MNISNPTLSEYCRHITANEPRILPPDHKLGGRLVCPEYSKSAHEVKTYPLPASERIFALCWTIGTDADPAAATPVLRATLAPSPQPFCYRLPFPSGEKTQLHTHDYIELAYVVEGEFRQRILGKDITFAKGDLCLIDKNCLHQDHLLDQPAVILFLGIANDMFSEIMDENVATQKIISFLQSALLKQKDVQQYLHFRPGPGFSGSGSGGSASGSGSGSSASGSGSDGSASGSDGSASGSDSSVSGSGSGGSASCSGSISSFGCSYASNAVSRLEYCLFLLLKELHENETGSHYICKGLLLRIFRIISTEYDFSLSREQRKTMNWLIFEEISDYIKRHYATVTIQDLVREFHFQEDYFNRIIKSKTGLTYSAYVQKIRLAHAEHMLTSTDKSVDEITELVGYHNKGYFYKIFQEKYKTTPSRYRKRR